MSYEELLIEADANDLSVKEKPLRGNLGRIRGRKIAIKEGLCSAEKACVLAEELGHYFTSHGNILDQSTIPNRKQERRARGWAYDYLMPLNEFAEAYEAGIVSRYDLARYFEITEWFLQEAVDYYRDKFGPYISLGEYISCFDPLGVIKFE